MRLISKYKIFYQSKKLIVTPTARILNFRRTKWKRLQTLVSSSIKPRNLAYRNNFGTKVKLKYWSKIKWHYKSCLVTRRLFNQLFDSSIKFSSLIQGNQKNFSNLFITSVIKPYFRIDILLWKLSLFNSAYEARQAVNESLILLNGKKVKPNIFLKKGDIICFSTNTCKLLPCQALILKRQISLNSTFLTFVEIDYYTKSFAIIKDLNTLSMQDFYFLFTTYFDIKKLKNSI